MRIRSLLSISLLMGLAGCSNYVATDANRGPVKRVANGEEISSLVRKYAGGEYTKKTQIFFDESLEEESLQYYHAGCNALTRTTYYSETANALLMGDYEGGFASINSGYASDGKGNMEHYRYKNANNPSVSDLFTARESNYVVNDTSPNEYFVNLTTIANSLEESEWIELGGVYSYEIGELTLVDDDYNDLIAHNIQFFAAPMMLQTVGVGETPYLTLTEAKIFEENNKLHIQLLSDSSEKLSNDNNLVAEAVIELGLKL